MTLAATTLLWLFILIFSVLVSACIPGTLYDPFDQFARGLRFYRYGRYDRAFNNWKPIAEEGDCSAQLWLGTLYIAGKGVEKNYAEARRWVEKAASQNHFGAQGVLGDMYSHRDAGPFYSCSGGCGVAKDLVMAYKWYTLSSQSDHTVEKDDADKALEAIRREMTPKQIQIGQELASQWRPPLAPCTPKRYWPQ